MGGCDAALDIGEPALVGHHADPRGRRRQPVGAGFQVDGNQVLHEAAAAGDIAAGDFRLDAEHHYTKLHVSADLAAAEAAGRGKFPGRIVVAPGDAVGACAGLSADI
jgi:hypothetical protein